MRSLAQHEPLARAEESRIRSSDEPAWPRSNEIELDVATDALEVALVVGHEDAAGLAARESKEHVVRERLRESPDLEPLLSRHRGQQIARAVPGVRRRGERPSGTLEDVQNMALEQPKVSIAPDASPQLLGHDYAEILER